MSIATIVVRLSLLVLLATLACLAQNPALAGMHREFSAAKASVLKAANKAPEDIYGFRPTPEVFTLRRMFLHIAGASYSICSSAAGKPGSAPKVDVTAESPKAEVIAKLNAAFAYCEDVFAHSSDATLAETVPTANGPREKSYYFSHLLGHTFLHYGNVVTYMRIKGMSPGD
ncbi:MAG: DinB family protein [Bryobacterales bacterium]|nr:DinB family protein [Bryobacterales bacterium]